MIGSWFEEFKIVVFKEASMKILLVAVLGKKVDWVKLPPYDLNPGNEGSLTPWA